VSHVLRVTTGGGGSDGGSGVVADEFDGNIANLL
jgi:hypothetical protein